jgi:hypothetical protein
VRELGVCEGVGVVVSFNFKTDQRTNCLRDLGHSRACEAELVDEAFSTVQLTVQIERRWVFSGLRPKPSGPPLADSHCSVSREGGAMAAYWQHLRAPGRSVPIDQNSVATRRADGLPPTRGRKGPRIGPTATRARRRPNSFRWHLLRSRR